MGKNRKSDRQEVKWVEKESTTDSKDRMLNEYKQNVRQIPKTES